MADDQAFLSARVPKEVRNRFKMLAASRGVNVQALLREVVGDYLKTQSVPEAAAVIRALRAHADELRELGVERLSLVGSVARGEAAADSDIDFAFAFKKDMKASYFDHAELKAFLEDCLTPYQVDVAPWKDLKPAVKKEMAVDAIEIL